MTLETRHVSSGYGKSIVCNDVSIFVGNGEKVCILGRNGVGKTTFLKTLMGLLPIAEGEGFMDQAPLRNVPSFRIARMGVGYVPQGRGIFAKLTVKDNLGLGTIAEKRRIAEVSDEVFQYFPILKERLNQRAGTLSGGEQQMLSIARALAGNPKLLLLDEPSEGIQPNIVQSLGEIINRVGRERNLTVLIVEQNLDFALSIASRGYVMEKGAIVESGSTEELRKDRIVQEYLGV
jgi:urea transport system ATP-binding protein